MVDIADRPFLMQGSAGHFYAIHSYASAMLTPVREANPTHGRIEAYSKPPPVF